MSSDFEKYTDKYFLRTKKIVQENKDVDVTYAVFIRRPVISAPRLMIEFLEKVSKERNTKFDIDIQYEEGKWVGAGEPILYLSGSFKHLVDLETIYLQKLGPACVAAWNAYVMATELPKTQFIAMDARHCAGKEMAELMAYAASVGSNRAKRKVGAVGFIGNATDATAHYFNQNQGLGTMPHALIGYANSTLKAAQLFHNSFPDNDLIVLVDYFAKEVTDTLEVCNHFKDLADKGKLAIRLDTPGSRFMEGLDPSVSYSTLEEYVPEAIRGYCSNDELRHLVGPGVSAAAIWKMRSVLNQNGFPHVKIVASSGFGPEKCKIMARAKAPIDIIGTGSFIPEKWSETYSTADIVEYDGEKRVKASREFLLR